MSPYPASHAEGVQTHTANSIHLGNDLMMGNLMDLFGSLGLMFSPLLAVLALTAPICI